MSRICLVGTGKLARRHAEVVRGIRGYRIATIVDADTAGAERMARRSGLRQVFASVEEALAGASFDRAHVLVPADLHLQAALPLLAAGKPVLLEQPPALDAEASSALLTAARTSGAALGINAAYIHHPAFVRLQRLVEKQELGRPVMVFCLRNVPFTELNGCGGDKILLQYGLHPLMQIAALAGPIDNAGMYTGPLAGPVPGEEFRSVLDLSLNCARLSARLRITVGRQRALWRVTAICDGGIAVADILENRIDTHGRTRWREAIQDLGADLVSAACEFNHAVRNILDAAASLVYPAGRGNPVYIGLCRSIAAFHAALDAGRAPQPDIRLAAELVAFFRRVPQQVWRDRAMA
jgi:predicted dehydrogenase